MLGGNLGSLLYGDVSVMSTITKHTKSKKNAMTRNCTIKTKILSSKPKWGNVTKRTFD